MVVASWKIAASVIIISRTTGRLLMLQRGSTAKFMPNAFVFPGGVLSPSDETMGPATKICALREAFEETGLCVTRRGVESAADSRELAELQDEVNKEPAVFEKVLEKTAIGRLIDWSCWLTPSDQKMRFMTSFFLLPIEGEPEIRMCQREMSCHDWRLPSDWLQLAGDLPPPQIYELTRLSQIPTGEWEKFSQNRAVLAPQKIFWDDGVHVTNVLSGDHLYIDENAELVPPRHMPVEKMGLDAKKPTHRIEYEKVKWARPSVYQHALEEPFRSLFPSFGTSSKRVLSKL